MSGGKNHEIELRSLLTYEVDGNTLGSSLRISRYESEARVRRTRRKCLDRRSIATRMAV